MAILWPVRWTIKQGELHALGALWCIYLVQIIQILSVVLYIDSSVIEVHKEATGVHSVKI